MDCGENMKVKTYLNTFLNFSRSIVKKNELFLRTLEEIKKNNNKYQTSGVYGKLTDFHTKNVLIFVAKNKKKIKKKERKKERKKNML